MTNKSKLTITKEAAQLRNSLHCSKLDAAIEAMESYKTIYYSGDVKCGGGKTEAMLDTVAGLYINQALTQEEFTTTTVIACKTTQLAAQSMARLHEKVNAAYVLPEDDANLLVPTIHISKDTFDNVVRSLVQYLRNFKGVIFCSHAALGLMNQHELLDDKHVIIDEVPSHELAGIIDLKMTDPEDEARWMRYVDLQPFLPPAGEELPPKDKLVYRVLIKPTEEARMGLQAELDNYDGGLNTAMSAATYRMFFYLLNKPEMEIMYRRKKVFRETVIDGIKQKIEQHQTIFEAVDCMRLKALYKKAMKVTYLAASFKSSLVHYLTKDILGYSVAIDETFSKGLEANHDTRLVLVPIMKNRNWSKYLRTSKANEKLVGYEAAEDSVLVQDVVLDLIADGLQKDYLLFANNDIRDKLDVNVMQEQGIEVLTTAIHGMNNYTKFTKAAFVASLNPSLEEQALLARFAAVYGKVADELIEAVKAERAYESCYQCVLRTAARKDDFEGIVVAYVPDMNHAEYIKNRFNEGCCVIDTRASLSERESDVKVNRRAARLDKAIAYFTAVKDKPKGTKIGDIQAEFGISKAGVNKWKKEFNQELKDRNLIK